MEKSYDIEKIVYVQIYPAHGSNETLLLQYAEISIISHLCSFCCCNAYRVHFHQCKCNNMLKVNRISRLCLFRKMIMYVMHNSTLDVKCGAEVSWISYLSAFRKMYNV